MILTNIYILVDKYKLLFCFASFSILLNVAFAGNIDHKPRKKKSHKVSLAPIVITAKDDIADYRGSYTQYFDLLHTKLDLHPDFQKKIVDGNAFLTLVPHFQPRENLTLDAKGMIIHHVIDTKSSDTLPIVYTGRNIIITFPRAITRLDTLILDIRYTAQPYQLDSAILEEGRGAYFINSEGKNKYKPLHFWTQGETESASCWFPTIESTKQKCTQELYVTYPDTMVSFSNGKLLNSIYNKNGTKTDYWKQDLPHAPYLFVLCIGPYKIFDDHWHDKSVQYFTFAKYFEDVEKVFGKTPEMIEYFSSLFRTPYPWDKYKQIVLYDYTAGAMENTSASVFYEPMFATHEDLIDRHYESIIAHELAHQWFGDLVTCESWANLTLNESFADYAEYLWYEHELGKDEAYLHHYEAWQGYLDEAKKKKLEPIVNYYYSDRWEIFDNHRYEKGGRVINMLRHYLGDEAFFEGLKKYLHDNAYKSAEVSDLRKAMEAVSGEDLNWFFNQWWYTKGHPILDIRYGYNQKSSSLQITIVQKQKDLTMKIPIFKLPLAIRIGDEKGFKDTTLWSVRDSATYYIPLSTMPSWILFDKDKVLLSEKNIHQSDTAWVNTYRHATNYIDKVDAINALSALQSHAYVRNFYLHALQDSFWAVRYDVLTSLLPIEWKDKAPLATILEKIVLYDAHPKVRTRALKLLRGIHTQKSFSSALDRLERDSSYSVKAEALQALRDSSSAIAYHWAKKYYAIENAVMTSSVASILADSARAEDFSFFERALSLQYYSTSYALKGYMEQYMRGVNLSAFEQCLLLLSDIFNYAENEGHRKNALSTIKSLLEECNENSQLQDIYNKSGKYLLLESHKQKFGL